MSVAYPLLKSLHIALVSASLSLFASRGLAVLWGARWPMQRVVRRASVLIDSALLAAGGGLWWMLQLNLTQHAWLLTKLILLVVYVLLGTWALKRAPTPAAKALCLALALATVGHMVGVALTKHPAGFLAGWLT